MAGAVIRHRPVKIVPLGCAIAKSPKFSRAELISSNVDRHFQEIPTPPAWRRGGLQEAFRAVQDRRLEGEVEPQLILNVVEKLPGVEIADKRVVERRKLFVTSDIALHGWVFQFHEMCFWTLHTHRHIHHYGPPSMCDT